LGGGLYKYRLEITGKPGGKSYGARIIYLVITDDNEIWYLACFDKSDLKDLPPAEKVQLRKLAKIITDMTSSERKDRFGVFGPKKK